MCACVNVKWCNCSTDQKPLVHSTTADNDAGMKAVFNYDVSCAQFSLIWNLFILTFSAEGSRPVCDVLQQSYLLT